MAPINPSDGLQGVNSQGIYSRPNNRRREHVNDRFVPSNRDHNSPEECKGIREASNGKHETGECRPLKHHRDKGGGRASGARRKDNFNKNNQKGSKPSTETAKRDRVYSECSDEHCPVCLNRMKIYAVGMCNHPVCSECSARMRILCAQNECPICRQDMPKVRNYIQI